MDKIICFLLKIHVLYVFNEEVKTLYVFLKVMRVIILQAVLCLLRWITGKNEPSHAIPAGLLAGVAFVKYPDTTVALYVMWKAAQVTTTKGRNRNRIENVCL